MGLFGAHSFAPEKSPRALKGFFFTFFFRILRRIFVVFLCTFCFVPRSQSWKQELSSALSGEGFFVSGVGCVVKVFFLSSLPACSFDFG